MIIKMVGVKGALTLPFITLLFVSALTGVLTVMPEEANAIDDELPFITIEVPTGGEDFKTATISVSGTARDDVGVDKVEVKIGSGDWELADLYLGFTVAWDKSVTLSAGSNTITARATDTSGNTKQVSVTVTYNPPDTTPPTITISTPTDGQEVTTQSITVSGTASDDKGLSKVEIQVGSGSWQVATGTSTWSKSVTLAAGSNTISARATDTADNIKQASVTVTYTPDTTLPTITIEVPTGGEDFKTATISVSGTARDDVGVDKVEVKIGSGDWELADLYLGFTVAWDKSVTLSAGSNTITARATDTADNIKETSVTVTYNPPTYNPPDTLPTISISAPTNGQEITTQSITVSGTASDNVGVSKVEIQVGSGSWQVATGTSTWSKSVTLAAGSNTISARATDTADNIKQASVTVTYNPPDTLPTISISAPTNGQEITTQSITVSGTASDNVGVSKVEIQVGSGGWQVASGTSSWSRSVTLNPGSNTIYARATDTSGNTQEALVTVTYTHDTAHDITDDTQNGNLFVDQYILDLCEHEVNGTYLADGVHEAKVYVVLRDKGTRRLAEAPSNIKVIIRSENSTAKPPVVNISKGRTKSEDISLTSIRPSIACVRAEAIGFEVATSYVEFVPSTMPSELLLEAHPENIPANGQDPVKLTVKLLCPNDEPFTPPQDTIIDVWTSTGESFNLTLSAGKPCGKEEFKTFKPGVINITAKSSEFEVEDTISVKFVSVISALTVVLSCFGGFFGGVVKYYQDYQASKEPEKRFLFLPKRDDLGMIGHSLFHALFGFIVYTAVVLKMPGLSQFGLPLNVWYSILFIGFLGGLFFFGILSLWEIGVKK